MDVKVGRNGWGSQVESFEADLTVKGMKDAPFAAVVNDMVSIQGFYIIFGFHFVVLYRKRGKPLLLLCAIS